MYTSQAVAKIKSVKETRLELNCVAIFDLCDAGAVCVTQTELSNQIFSKKSLVARLPTNQQISTSAPPLARPTMPSNSLNFIFSDVCFVFISRRVVFHSVVKNNSDFVFGLLRLLKLWKRLVKTNLAQSPVANQSGYFYTNQQQSLQAAFAFSRARSRLHAFASNSDCLAVYFPLLLLSRLALFKFQRHLTQALCH